MKFLPLLVWCAVSACGRVAPSDAGNDAALPDGAEAGPCNPLAPTLPPGNCPQLDAICQQWASSAAQYGVSVCYFDSVTGSNTCQSPDNATCNGVVCMDGQVCSAPPNGPHQCVTACAGQ